MMNVDGIGPPEGREVLHFWFDELTPDQWFKRDAAIDQMIAQRFGPLYERLSVGVPTEWQDQANAILAAVIVLDQFPRNMFRDHARALATDAMALALADTAITRNFHRHITRRQRSVLYLPFMHSEDPVMQARSVSLYGELDDATALDFARRHQAIIDRFGRFPHRNNALGRVSTAEELAFLGQPGSLF